MPTTVLSSKGQVIIPKEVRTLHRWRPGVRFEVIDTPEGVLLKPEGFFPSTSLEDGLGCAGYRGPRLSDEEIRSRLNAAVCRQWPRNGS